MLAFLLFYVELWILLAIRARAVQYIARRNEANTDPVPFHLYLDPSIEWSQDFLPAVTNTKRKAEERENAKMGEKSKETEND